MAHESHSTVLATRGTLHTSYDYYLIFKKFLIIYCLNVQFHFSLHLSKFYFRLQRINKEHMHDSWRLTEQEKTSFKFRSHPMAAPSPLLQIPGWWSEMFQGEVGKK